MLIDAISSTNHRSCREGRRKRREKIVRTGPGGGGKREGRTPCWCTYLGPLKTCYLLRKPCREYEQAIVCLAETHPPHSAVSLFLFNFLSPVNSVNCFCVRACQMTFRLSSLAHGHVTWRSSSLMRAPPTGLLVRRSQRSKQLATACTIPFPSFLYLFPLLFLFLDIGVDRHFRMVAILRHLRQWNPDMTTVRDLTHLHFSLNILSGGDVATTVLLCMKEACLHHARRCELVGVACGAACLCLCGTVPY